MPGPILLKKVFTSEVALVDPAPDPIRERLQQAGYRLTRPRRAVIRAVREAGGWLRPEQVHARARRLCPSLGLVTVYRALDLLVELRVIRRLHLEDGCHGYVRSELDHGHHLVCRACQRVVEFPGSEDLGPLFEQVAARTGYLVETHMLELIGLCPRCQAQGRRRSKRARAD